jgi:hypothetical protein
LRLSQRNEDVAYFHKISGPLFTCSAIHTPRFGVPFVS